jgi:choline dehydrogenase-like flavoprotein
VGLSDARDRFGDPFAHVHYKANEFDEETYLFARKIFKQFAAASGAVEAQLDGAERYHSGFHHMGGCRMGTSQRDSVVDPFGQVHGTRGLFVAGGSTFVSSGAVNPTLTMVALAIRTSEYLADQAL